MQDALSRVFQLQLSPAYEGRIFPGTPHLVDLDLKTPYLFAGMTNEDVNNMIAAYEALQNDEVVVSIETDAHADTWGIEDAKDVGEECRKDVAETCGNEVANNDFMQVKEEEESSVGVVSLSSRSLSRSSARLSWHLHGYKIHRRRRRRTKRVHSYMNKTKHRRRRDPRPISRCEAAHEHMRAHYRR